MTNEEVMEMMTDMGLHEGGMDNWVTDNAWVKFANVVAQHEREACAEVCDSLEEQCEKLLVPDEKWPTPADCANIIRARGQA